MKADEILFRAKPAKPTSHGMDGKVSWEYGGFYYDDCCGSKNESTHKAYIINWNTFGFGHIDHVEVDKATVCQYTGVKTTDCAPRNIYVNDFVLFTTELHGHLEESGVVIYSDGSFVILMPTGEKVPLGACSQRYTGSNVIDNPEVASWFQAIKLNCF